MYLDKSWYFTNLNFAAIWGWSPLLTNDFQASVAGFSHCNLPGTMYSPYITNRVLTYVIHRPSILSIDYPYTNHVTISTRGSRPKPNRAVWDKSLSHSIKYWLFFFPGSLYWIMKSSPIYWVVQSHTLINQRRFEHWSSTYFIHFRYFPCKMHMVHRFCMITGG